MHPLLCQKYLHPTLWPALLTGHFGRKTLQTRESGHFAGHFRPKTEVSNGQMNPGPKSSDTADPKFCVQSVLGPKYPVPGIVSE